MPFTDRFTLGLRRLGELAGLMESGPPDAAKAGEIRPNRASQISDAAEASPPASRRGPPARKSLRTSDARSRSSSRSRNRRPPGRS